MGIWCDSCECWTHARCASVSSDEYIRLSKKPDHSWFCITCLARELPFIDCSSLSIPDPAGGCKLNELHALNFDEAERCHLLLCHLNIRSIFSQNVTK